MTKPMEEPWRGETYHGRSALKPAGFDWKVAAYILAQGVAGSAQVIAGAARAAGDGDHDGLVRRARLLSVAGNLLGTAVLIGHLKTPKRWYNMLRIVRPQSPMSWGSWLLVVFGAASAATALGELLGGRFRWAWRLGEAAQAPASLAGAGMSVYTASLLSTTSNPLWSAAPAPLAAGFGAASMANAASALALLQRNAGEHGSARRLEALAALAAGGEYAAMRAAERRWREVGVGAPLREGGPKALFGPAAKGLGVALPVATQALALVSGPGAPARDRLPPVASLGLLIGGFALRHALLRAGDESAKRPGDYFRAAQGQPNRADR